MVGINTIGGALRATALAGLILLWAGGCAAGSDNDEFSALDESGPSIPATTTAPVRTTQPSQPSHPTPPPTTDAAHTTPITSPSTGATQQVEFAQLRDAYPSLVDQRVVVEVRSFFVETCPPPDGGGGSCTLTLYAAEPDRDDLVYAERDRAAAVLVDAKRVSCAVTGDIVDACPGWQQRALYRLTATIRAERGGTGFALDAEAWEPIGGEP
jgi:hypothetical protein